jgi:hypothetical protein
VRALLALALAPTLAACADDALRDPPDAGGDAAAGCRAPTAAPPWLDDYLATVIARLSGAADVAPGVRLADRATSARRAAARTFLRDELAAAGLAATFDDYGTGANVTAELPATTGGAAPLVLVGAHLDSVAGSPGADDNASGAAAVLAIARMLAAVPCRDRPVRFVLFDQEEVGLVGSTYLAGALRQAGTAVAAVHTPRPDRLGRRRRSPLRDRAADRRALRRVPGRGRRARRRGHRHRLRQHRPPGVPRRRLRRGRRQRGVRRRRHHPRTTTPPPTPRPR